MKDYHKDSIVDILDYEKYPSATEVTIYNIAGMEKLAELVNGETDDFSGKMIRLAADLKYDKTVENNYTVICGEGESSFKGTFDGGFHTISGINIDSSMGDAGLFGLVIGAKISRVILKDSRIASQGINSFYNSCAGIVSKMFLCG